MLRKTLQDMQIMAKLRGGKCLSESYINSQTKLKWQCERGHLFLSLPNDVQQGHWCPECAKSQRNKSQINTIENMHKFASMFGGKCLSTSYKNSTSKLDWQCKDGHKFSLTPTRVKYNGQWCSLCRSRLVGEKICRAYFESIFDKEFDKWRPQNLRSRKNTVLEFDGYNEELNIAFEYHGAQHYFPVKRFLKKRTFDDQKTVDAYKKSYCMSQLIHFIEVPYTISYTNMGKFIIAAAREKGFKILTSKEDIDFHKFHIYPNDAILPIQKIALERGGKCLSEKYVDNLTELEFECKYGHKWKTAPKMIKKGSWCLHCTNKIPRTINNVIEIVKSKSGELLSGDYINNRSKMTVKCPEGHIWQTNLHELKKGAWCPKCAGLLKLTIEEMQEVANQKQGKCISETYTNSQTSLLWECKNGHRWEARPTSIKRGGWCPYCSKRVKLTIKEMQNLAVAKGGVCLSSEYINNKTKLLWQCKNGHQWWQKPETIKNGHWCGKCSRKKDPKLT